jgi:glutathione S-transferase
MLTLWGRINSSNVMKVLWTLDELGLAYEQFDIGGAFGGNREAAYLAKNPNGLIPTLEDGDQVFWESNAIVRYLAARYGAAPFYRADPAGRAVVDGWMDWTLTTVNAPMTPLFWGYVRTPADQRDPVALEEARKKAVAAWTILQTHLTTSAQPHICGPDLTPADIALGPFAHRWFSLPIERPAMPALEAWYQRLKLRPGYAKWVAVAMT